MLNKATKFTLKASIFTGGCYILGTVGEIICKSLETYWLGFIIFILKLFTTWLLPRVILVWLMLLLFKYIDNKIGGN